jgi:hypothetical protein
VKIVETLGTIAFATVRQSFFNCRTRFGCDSRINAGSEGYRLSHENALVLLRLRQCDSSELTVANRLSQSICVSATVPYYIGTACNDRRSAAAPQRGVTQRRSAARSCARSNMPQKLKVGGKAELKARSAQRTQTTDIPYWPVAGRRL